jgi:hypothetical protein
VSDAPKRSEWIVDAGEDGGAFATPSDVDEADHDRCCAASRDSFRQISGNYSIIV